MSINNARAVVEALRGRQSEFRRTPKYNLARGESIASRRYRSGVSLDTWVESVLAVYFTVAVAAAAASDLWAAVPFLMLFQVGYAYTAVSTVVQAARRVVPTTA